MKKENAFEKLQKDFESYSIIVNKQLRTIENIISSETVVISDKLNKELKNNEKAIDNYEIQFNEDVITIIVLHSPVATELRRIMAYFRISHELERIGDLSMNVVRYINKINNINLFNTFAEAIGSMLTIGISMVEKALFAFDNNDMDYAIWTIKSDDIVDDMNTTFRKKIIKQSSLKGRTKIEISDLYNMMSIVSNIERIADCATNIAEAAIFSAVGQDVRHKNIKSVEKELDS